MKLKHVVREPLICIAIFPNSEFIRFGNKLLMKWNIGVKKGLCKWDIVLNVKVKNRFQDICLKDTCCVPEVDVVMLSNVTPYIP